MIYVTLLFFQLNLFDHLVELKFMCPNSLEIFQFSFVVISKYSLSSKEVFFPFDPPIFCFFLNRTNKNKLGNQKRAKA